MNIEHVTTEHIILFFEKVVPVAVKKYPTETSGIKAIYEFELIGDITYTVDMRYRPPQVYQGACTTAKPDCIIKITAEDLNALIKTPNIGAVAAAIAQKKIHVSSIPHAMTLMGLMRLASQ